MRSRLLLRMMLWSFLVWALLNLLLPPRVALAEAQIQTGTTPTTAFLQLGDQVLLDQPGFHLSKPTLSPDGRWLAVTMVPTGADTAAFATIYLFDRNSGEQFARLPGHSPTWVTDQPQLNFESATSAYTYHLLEQRLEERTRASSTDKAELSVVASVLPLAYPTTIRVAHHPSNGCRSVPEWQVDVIPFEEYVARVVPAEVPVSWPAAALEAMAVAARTYAWRQILVGRRDYDVTDWANFQMMCDERYPSSDAAVIITAGQYLTAKEEMAGVPISAMYSAENGHPTLTNVNVTYLQAVPDLFALGRTRWGHGYGLSQWGAYRRARAGQNYRQILGHYYSKVYLQNGSDPTQATGGLVNMLPQNALATDSLYLRALVAADEPARLVITASAGLTMPVTLLGSEALWRAHQPLPENTGVTAQLWLFDQLYDQVTWTVDHMAPAPPVLQVPVLLTQPVASLTFPTVANVTPIINTNRVWQGEELRHTVNSGATLSDVQAADGIAWQARVGAHQPGVWYGPYSTLLPAGYSYRALFWLRAGRSQSAALADQVVARLDVTDADGEVRLGLRDLWTSDFATIDRYTPIAVDFHVFTAPQGLEFRVAWPGKVDLALDRVEIWRLPSNSDKDSVQFDLPFYGQQGNVTVGAAQMDSAGNRSEGVNHMLTLLDGDAPQIGPWPLSTRWLSTPSLAVAVAITDSFSGIDTTQSHFVLEQQPMTETVPTTFPADKLIWQGQVMTGTLVNLADGRYLLHLQVADRAGNRRDQSYPLLIDTQPPTVTAHLPTAPVQGWYTEPVTLVLAAMDNGSGVAQIDYTVTPAVLIATAIHSATQFISLTTGGIHTISYAASDHAGNRTTPNTLTVPLDLAAPVVTLQQYSLRANTTRIAWQIRDDGAGVHQVEMQIQRGDEPWQAAPWDYLSLTTTDIDLDPETPTKVRARARDQLGRMSDWVTMELWNAAAWLYLPLVKTE